MATIGVEVLLGDLVPGRAARLGQGVVDDPRAGLVCWATRLLHRVARQLRRPEDVAQRPVDRAAARAPRPWRSPGTGLVDLMSVKAGSGGMLLVGSPVEVLTARFAAVVWYWAPQVGQLARRDVLELDAWPDLGLAEHRAKEQLGGLARRP